LNYRSIILFWSLSNQRMHLIQSQWESLQLDSAAFYAISQLVSVIWVFSSRLVSISWNNNLWVFEDQEGNIQSVVNITARNQNVQDLRCDRFPKDISYFCKEWKIQVIQLAFPIIYLLFVVKIKNILILTLHIIQCC